MQLLPQLADGAATIAHAGDAAQAYAAVLPPSPSRLRCRRHQLLLLQVADGAAALATPGDAAQACAAASDFVLAPLRFCSS